MNLFLDDIRQPKDAFLVRENAWLEDYSKIPSKDWVIVRNYDEFVNFIEKNGIPNAVAFDCDLHKEHMRHYIGNDCLVYEWENFQNKCGIHCAKYLKDEMGDKPVKVFIHTANDIGRDIIRSIFED